MYINIKRVTLPDTAGTYLAYALISLMEKKPIEEISITELTKKAGVSRMSYYRSFDSKQHILEEHLQTIIRRFRIEGEKRGYLGKEHGYEQLLYAYRFFRHHSRYSTAAEPPGSPEPWLFPQNPPPFEHRPGGCPPLPPQSCAAKH